MKSLAIAILALALTVPPGLAAETLKFGAELAPYKLRVTLHFPEGEGRAHEADCTPGQVELFRTFFAGYLKIAADGLVRDFEAANGVGRPGTVLPLDFQVGCSPDGGALITNFTPEQRWTTQHYDPSTGRWELVG